MKKDESLDQIWAQPAHKIGDPNLFQRLNPKIVVEIEKAIAKLG